MNLMLWKTAGRPAVVLLLVSAMAVPALGDGIRISYDNDLLTSNELEDDLYTGALEVELSRGRYTYTFGENVFTDSERDLRFDETFATVSRQMPSLGAWQTEAALGVVHVGRGLLGQSAQNAIHRLVGDKEVDLPYVDDDRVHATVGLRAFRPLGSWEKVSLTLHGELYSALGFKHHLQSGARVRWQMTDFATLVAGAGARLSRTSFAPLEPRIDRFAPTWQAGVVLLDHWNLSWSYNDFGTGAQHFSMGYEFKPTGGRGGWR